MHHQLHCLELRQLSTLNRERVTTGFQPKGPMSVTIISFVIIWGHMEDIKETYGGGNVRNHEGRT